MKKQKRSAADKKKRVEKTQKRLNFVLLVIFAAGVIALAVIYAITLAQQHMMKPKEEEPIIKQLGDIAQKYQAPEEDRLALEEAMNYWPAAQFPSVPKFEASKYITRVEAMRAEIVLPAEDALKLSDYVDSLTASGAAVHIRTDSLIVLVQAGTEIQIRPTGAKPSIVLGGEPQVAWKGADYPDFVLPASGKLVSAKPSGSGAVFVIRNAAVTDALLYLDQLKKAGWAPEGKLNFKNGTLLATYAKNGQTVTVDYFATGADCRIELKRKAEAPKQTPEAQDDGTRADG